MRSGPGFADKAGSTAAPFGRRPAGPLRGDLSPLPDYWELLELRHRLHDAGCGGLSWLDDRQVIALAARVLDDLVPSAWTSRRLPGGSGGRRPIRQPPEERVPADAGPETTPGPDGNGPVPQAPPAPGLSWIEVELVDEEGIAYGGESCRVVLTDGVGREARLDDAGVVRFDGILEGSCRFDFPDLVAAALDEG